MARRISATEPRGSTRGDRGFTLVESLIATSVLAVAVLGITGMLMATHVNDGQRQSIQRRTDAARDRLEATVSVTFASDGVNPYLGDLNNTSITTADGVVVLTTVTYATAPGNVGGGGAFATVVVVATSPDGQSTTLRRLAIPDYLKSS